MANQLYKDLQAPARSPFSDLRSLREKYDLFRQNFSGDPKAIVQQMLNNGTMSQAQFNQLRTMAEQFQNLMQSFKS